MPSLLRAIVNSLIPEDKKSKVEFIADGDIKNSMRKLCEPHQIEEQYGGTAPNVKAGEVYPFRFFPHCRGPNSGGNPPQTSLHQVADRLFHEGVSLDRHDQDLWKGIITHQPVTKGTAKALADLLHAEVKPTTSLDDWLKKFGTPDANKLLEDQKGKEQKADDPKAEKVEAVPVLPDDIFNQEEVVDATLQLQNSNNIMTEKKPPGPLMEGESSAVCCVCGTP